MADYVADTHGIVWYLQDDPRLGKEANKAFEECDAGEGVIFVPTICLVELVYLQEKGRIPADLKTRLDAALSDSVGGLVATNLTREVVSRIPEIPRTDVPDMPDRIIAATALCLRLPLISKDRRIVTSGINTLW